MLLIEFQYVINIRPLYVCACGLLQISRFQQLWLLQLRIITRPLLTHSCNIYDQTILKRNTCIQLMYPNSAFIQLSYQCILYMYMYLYSAGVEIMYSIHFTNTNIQNFFFKFLIISMHKYLWHQFCILKSPFL